MLFCKVTVGSWSGCEEWGVWDKAVVLRDANYRRNKSQAACNIKFETVISHD